MILSIFDIVPANSPLADSTSSEHGPVLVVKRHAGENVVLCQITTKQRPARTYEFAIAKDDCDKNIRLDSYVYRDELFRLHQTASNAAGRRAADCGEHRRRYRHEHRTVPFSPTLGRHWPESAAGTTRSPASARLERCRLANRRLRRALTEVAWAAAHSKHTYLTVQYGRIGAQCGSRRRILTFGHAILTIACHVLQDRPV